MIGAMSTTSLVPIKLGGSIYKRLLRLVLLPAVILIVERGQLEAQTPEIVTLGTPQLWQRAEFQVDHAPAATNCFDPDLIRLDATFTPPSGHSLTVPAFWYQDYSRARERRRSAHPDGRTTMADPVHADGTRQLHINVERPDQRYAGGQAGRYAHFNVSASAPSGQRGYVRVAPDKRYFEMSDGRPLRLIGQNVCWAGNLGTYDYDTWFGGMKGAGENFARLWLAPWFMGLEHKTGTLNHYDLQGAWQLDYIFSLAEQDGIYLMLCGDHHGMYQVDNPGWDGSLTISGN